MEESSVDKVIYESSKHCKESFTRMAEFRDKDQLTDIILVAGDKRISAHKVIISSLCDYFSAMFTGELSETRQQVVTLNDIEPDALEAIVDYAYTSKLEIRVDNVESLLASSSILQIPDVKDACCDFMKSQLHPSNCLGIRAFADAHGCDKLFKIADKYAKHNFLDVCKNQEFFLLSPEQLFEILCSDGLNVTSEEQVFNCVVSWMNHDYENRRHFVYEVLKCVRLALLCPTFIVDEVQSFPPVKESSDCKDLLLEAMEYHLVPERRTQLPNLVSKPRKGTVGVLHAIGGLYKFLLLIYFVYVYACLSDFVYTVPAVETERCRN